MSTVKHHHAASTAVGITSEQLQLLQLCFGEHEFGTHEVSADDGRTAISADAAGIAAAEGDAGSVGRDGKDEASDGVVANVVVLDYNPVEFIDEKLQHGISLDVLCSDLATFERHLQSRILQHVHEDVYEAFVSVSGELVGVDEQLTRVCQPLLTSKHRIESAMQTLAEQEHRVVSTIEAAETQELHRQFHVGVVNALLTHDTLCDSVDALERRPFFSMLKEATSSSATARPALARNALPAEDDVAALRAVVVDLFDLEGVVRRTVVPPPLDRVDGKTLQATHVAELEELQVITEAAHKHIVGILSQAFLAVHSVYSSLAATVPATPPTLPEGPVHFLRCFMELFAIIGPQEFATLYRDQVVRAAAEEVLSWKASAQARGASVEQSAALIDELCRQLEATLLPLAQVMRDVFGSPHVCQGGTTDAATTVGSTTATLLPIPHIFWPPVCNTVVSRMMWLFLSGNPVTFHKHFTAAHRVLSLMEGQCSTIIELQALRSATETTLWMHKWNVDVYHTIRANEASEKIAPLIAAFKAAAAAASNAAIFTEGGSSASVESGAAFALKATQGVADVVLWLFSDEVFLFPISHRLLRNAMIFVVDYVREIVDVSKAALERLGGDGSGDASAKLFGAVLGDCETLASSFVPETLRRAVEAATGDTLASCPIMSNIFTLTRDAVHKHGVTAVRAAIVSSLVTRCDAVLQNVKTVKATYSHTKKPMPSAPSWYVSGVFEPLTKFKAVAGAGMPLPKLQTLTREAIDEVTSRLRAYTKETIISARKMEESLGKLRRKREEAKTAAAVSGALDGSNNNAATSSKTLTVETATDRDKMVVQLYLDAHEYGSLLRPFGVNKESYAPLQSVLKLCRRAEWLLGGAVDGAEPAEVEEDE